jgi:hypothetical protein
VQSWSKINDRADHAAGKLEGETGTNVVGRESRGTG